MQIRKTHRILAALLVLTMVIGLVPVTALARSAGNDGSAEMNEDYAAHESLMPIGPSFNVDTLLEWTPESDPDAIYSKASIALADRTGGFVVNPLVNPEAKLMLCSLANSDHDHTSAQGTEDFLSYSFNYWQYTNSFVYWSGSEEGLVVCPTGEFTDAAHTNGVPVVATLGFPWGSGSGYVDQVKKFVQKTADGSFPVADKLIEVMDYYGFDGYFFNQESYGCSATEGALIDEMMRYMHKKRPDMLISWYDSMLPSGGVSYQNAVNSANSAFMKESEDGTRAIDEFFMNYNWGTTQIETTISTMKSIGRSQFDAFAGIDVQQNCMRTYFNDHLLVDEDGMTRMSLALYCPNSTLGLSTSGENFHEVEQTFYTNAKGDPRDISVNLKGTTWAGMSRFYADKTTILKAPFVTDFNSGHGRGYYVDGVLSRDAEWSYQSNQDVMPTWTWIIDSEGEKLTGGYDFSTAFNGGNSIKFSGNLTANKANDIMLFSTKVAVEAGMKLGLTYKGDQGIMKLVAYYGDAGTESYEACEKKEFLLSDSEGEWTSVEASLTSIAGKILYAIGLKIESEEDVTDYQVNLGRLTLTERTRAALNGPATVALDEIMYKDAYTAEARVFWSAVTGASSYEIYKVNADGSKTLIMETPNTAFYIPTLTRDAGETSVKLEVVAINRNGVRGTKGTQLTINWAYGDEDTEKVEVQSFENVCLNANVTSVSYENSGEPASKALDGTSANNSKWCATNQSTGYLAIDVGREVTVKRWRVEHGQYGGEDKLTNTDTFALQYKNAEGSWVEIKKISGNTDAVTDVLLDEPVTAQEWRLYVYNAGHSPWQAIRIYEWQMFETDQFPQTVPVAMHFASAENNAGATDTFTLANIPNEQTVKLYTKTADGYTLIGEKSGTGTVEFTDLDFGTAEAGRVYYTCTAACSAESAKLSVAFEAETAEKSAAAENVSFVKYSHAGSVSSSNGDDIYTTLTVNDLSAGDVVYVYENGADEACTKTSLPVAEGATSVSISNVRVVRAGGTLALQVKRAGSRISDVYTVNTPAFEAPTGTIRLFARNEAGESLTGVSYGIFNEAGEMVSQISTTSDSGGSAAVPLGSYTLKCVSVPEGYGIPKETVQKILRIEGWEYEINVVIGAYVDPAVTDITVTPSEVSIPKGSKSQLTAVVTGVGNFSEDVNWTISGNTSENTTVSETGLVTIGADEAAKTLTVTATSAVDSTKFGTATVTVTKLVNIALNSSIWAYSLDMDSEGAKTEYDPGEGTSGPEKLFDGKMSDPDNDKWCVDGNQWVMVDLGQWVDLQSVKIYHAGVNGEYGQTEGDMNTDSYELRIINQSDTYYDYWMGCNYSELGYWMNMSTYNTVIASRTGNRDNITIDTFDEPVKARYLMLKVTNSDSTGWAKCVRIYEMEVFADVPEMNEAAEAVEALIDAIKTATDKDAAIAAARAAYDALSKAEQALVSNYNDLVKAEEGGEEPGGDLEAAVAAAEAAQKAAEDAAKAAEEAKAAAEAAQKAAEEAAASAAEDKAAAEKAAEEAAAAQAKAEEAIAAAEEAAKAAEDAAKAAEESNVAAAQEAQKAAEEAAKAATSASDAAKYAAEAAEAQKGAQAAREAAEAAQAAAEEAQKKAEDAQKAAEEAAASSAEDKEAAENAKKEAEAAKEAAEAAKKAAEDAEAAAKAAEESAAAHDAAAAQAAAEAAKYAQEIAEKYEEICAMKAEMTKYLLDAQKSAEAAEEARKAAEAAELLCAKYYAQFTLATYADVADYAAEQQSELAAAIEAGTKAIEAAESIEAVNKALADAKAAIDAIKTIKDLEAEKLPFTDVTENDWFFNAVKYAYQNGIMVGADATTFNPNGTLTRGQLVAMLYRMAGAPEVTEKAPFTDVPETMYYADAIAWAYANEVAFGKSATTFEPETMVTREEMAAFLARFAKYQGVYEEADEKVLEKFEDAESIQNYAVPYIAWAVENGIMSGMSESTMAPRGTAKRCQAANLMMNYQLTFAETEAE